MFILANLIYALATVLSILINILIFLIFLRALVSWVSADPYNPLVQFLYKTTEPILQPLRRVLPISLRMGIDISPIIAFLVLMFIRVFIVKTLIDLSMRLKMW
jgi:YggT family protein